MLLYIDPGMGSMLITVILAIIGSVFYFLEGLLLKFKYINFKRDNKMSNTYDIVFFSDDKRYWNVFEPICEEFENRKTKVMYLTMSEDDPAIEKEYEYVRTEYLGKVNIAFAKMNRLKAKIVVSTTPNLDVFQWKRSKFVNCYIHIPHTPSDLTMYKMFGIDFYDVIFISGEYQHNQIRELEELRGLIPKELYYIGIPYLDAMYKRFKTSSVKRKSDKTVVLLAPSWGQNAILSKYGKRLINQLLELDVQVVIRPHPQSFVSEKEIIEELIGNYKGNTNVLWNRDNDNFNVLRDSDILISDFSGIIFEYALVFDKPIIYTLDKYDTSTYDCSWSSTMPWTLEILPDIALKLDDDNFNNLGYLIDKCLSEDTFKAGREKAKTETWKYFGAGTERAVNYIEGKLKTINQIVEV